MERIEYTNLTEISNEQKLLTELKDDAVAQVMNNVYNFNSLSFDDLCVLTGYAGNNKSKFNEAEIRWFSVNYRIWLRIIKGCKDRKQGRRIFQAFYKYANNVKKVSRELKIYRSSVYWWVKKLSETFMLVSHPTHSHFKTNDHLLVLNHHMYPKLILLTLSYIKHQINKENQTLTTKQK